jgi:peptidyl-prolyl cis-trans isomerase A (cyclophilin A)
MAYQRIHPHLCGLIIFLSLSGCAPKNRPAVTPASADTPPKALSETLPQRPIPPRYQTTDKVEIKTSLGAMTVALYGKAAPNTVANFLKYVDRGFYNGKIFHRVIDGFMIQGGGFTESLDRSETDEPIRLEIIPGLKHQDGVISMARQPNDVNSATTQFFICTADAPQLNGTYAAFGKLLTGEEVLQAISRVPTHSVETNYGKMNDVPIKPVFIVSISRL